MQAIEVRGISKAFKAQGTRFHALQDVSLTVRQSETFALVGPNGSGKTTLIHIILALLRPDSGEVKVFGKDPFKERSVLEMVNFVPYHGEAPGIHLTVKDFLDSFGKLYNVPEKRSLELIKEFDLEKLAKKQCWTLSTGESSLLWLAKALINHPRLLVLDEPMAGLDPKVTGSIRKKLREINRAGTTIFFASHNMVEVGRIADRVAFIKEGKILDIGGVKAIKRRYGTLERYWLRLGR